MLIGKQAYLRASGKPLARRCRKLKLSAETLNLMRHVGEVSAALRQLKNGRAPGDDGFTTELFKPGGKPLLTALARLFNATRASYRKRGPGV